MIERYDPFAQVSSLGQMMVRLREDAECATKDGLFALDRSRAGGMPVK
jgi:hypothetical protein